MWFDSHAHLGELDRDEYLETLSRAELASVRRILNIGADLEDSERVLHQASFEKTGVVVDKAVGISAAAASLYSDTPDVEIVDRLKKLCSHPSVIALGEMGIDGVQTNYADIETQLRVFRLQLDLARELDLPVIIHSRGLELEALRELRSASINRALFHCYTGSIEDAAEITRSGYSISLSGIVTFKKSDMDGLIASIPQDLILIETDSPYLAPVPFRGGKNEPAYVANIGRYCADVRGVDHSLFAESVASNYRRLFRVD